MGRLTDSDEVRSFRSRNAIKLFIEFLLSGFVSFAIAVLSLSAPVIKVFFYAFLFFLVASLVQFYREKYSSAHSLAIAPIPLSLVAPIVYAMF